MENQNQNQLRNEKKKTVFALGKGMSALKSIHGAALLLTDNVVESNLRKEELAKTEKKIVEIPKFNRSRNNGKFKLYNDNFINGSLHLFNRSLNFRH